jgi:hypothetical protein
MLLIELPEDILFDLVGNYCDNTEIRRTRTNMRVAHDASVTYMGIRNRGAPSPTAASLSATVIRSPNLKAISIGGEEVEEVDAWRSEFSVGAAALRAMHGAGRADRLHDLVLYGPLDDTSVDVTDSLADAIRPFTGLRTFKSHDFLNPSAARSMLAAVGGGVGFQMPHMTSLSLWSYDLSLSGPALLSALARMPGLTEQF